MKKRVLAVLCTLSLWGCSEPQTAAVQGHSGVILADMDRSVVPGDDLFRFVNGNWLKTTQIPADRSADGAFHRLRDESQADVRVLVDEAVAEKAKQGSSQQIADLYLSYLERSVRDQLGTQPLQPLLQEIDRVTDQANLARAFARSMRVGGGTPLAFWIGADEMAPDRNALYLYQTGLTLPDRDYYLKQDATSQGLRNDLCAHIMRQLQHFGFSVQESSVAAKEILRLETQIAKIQWDRVALRDRNKSYNKHRIEDLSQLVTGFDWKSYLDEAGLNSAAEVIVTQPSYLQGLDPLLKETPLKSWRYYLKWQLIKDYAPLLDQASDREQFAFFGKRLSGTPQQRPDWERGLMLLENHLGELVGQRYVERYFPPQAKARMEALVENLRLAYGESIKELDWMSAETKAQALVKLNKFRPKIGYPNKWKDYRSIVIKRDDLVGNVLRAKEFEYADQIARLQKPVDRDEWFMTPQTVNAYYNPSNNEVVFPAAILQPPFFDLNADDAVNYGAIGGVIGHEMGHGFDDQGAKSDGDGMLRNWWSKADQEEFQRRTQKLVTQYNRFEPLPGHFIDGEFTLGENIGDLGGLTIAHRAYMISLQGKPAPVLDNFSGEQRFFIGWAQVWKGRYRPEMLKVLLSSDPHSPQEYRVNGVVPNMPEFYRAFAVTPQNRLYLPPEQRVKIW